MVALGKFTGQTVFNNSGGVVGTERLLRTFFKNRFDPVLCVADSRIFVHFYLPKSNSFINYDITVSISLGKPIKFFILYISPQIFTIYFRFLKPQPTGSKPI